MSSVELKHKWHVRRDAWYIRLYVFAWSAYSLAEHAKVTPSETDINFCKLFWGYLLMPVAFLFFKPLFHLIDTIVWAVRKIPRRRAALATGSGPTIPVAAPKPKRDPSRFLTWVSEAFVRLSMRVQAVWLRVRKPVLWSLLVLAVLVALAAVGAIVYIIGTNVDETLRVLGLTALALGVLAVLLVVIVGLERVGFWRMVGRGLQRLGRGGKRKVKGGTLGFAGAMRVGYHAVKTNTCPEIVLDGAAASSGERRPSGSSAG